MSTKVLGATTLALLLSVSVLGIDTAIAQTGGTQSNATKKSLDDKHLTPVRPIRRVGEDSWPAAKNQPAPTRETTGQSAEKKEDTAQTAQTTSKPDEKNSNQNKALGNQSPPPDRPEDTAKQNAQPKQDTAKQDTRQNTKQGQAKPETQQAQQPAPQQNDKQNMAETKDRKDDKGFASIRLGTDSSGRVAVNDAQERQVTSVLRKHHVETVNVRVSVGSVAPANVKLTAVSSDFIDVFPQFRGYSFFATADNVVIVEPESKKVVALVPVKLTATASRSREDRVNSQSNEERTTTRTETRPSRTRTVVRERDVTVGQGIPTEAEILAAPVVRGPAGTTVTRTYRRYQYEPDDDVVIIERSRPRLFPLW